MKEQPASLRGRRSNRATNPLRRVCATGSLGIFVLAAVAAAPAHSSTSSWGRPSRADLPAASFESGPSLVAIAEPTTVGDPMGDTFGVGALQLDLAEFSLENDGVSLVILEVFYGGISPGDSGNANAAVGYVDLDTDRNPATGGPCNTDTFTPHAPTGLGCDFAIDLFATDSGAGTAGLIDLSSFATVATVPVRFFGNAFLVRVPLALLGLSAGSAVDGATVIGTVDEPTDVAPNGGHVTSSDDVTRLNGDRFQVDVAWRDFMNNTGKGHLVGFRSDDSAIFWFFNPNNWEVMIKILRGCPLNDRYWVFFAATTTVEYTVTVIDRFAGVSKTYTNLLGVPSPAVTDTAAFATCP